MARYNRDFLVPYLRNICALHMAKDRIWEWKYQVSKQKDELRYKGGIQKPEKPTAEYPMGCGSFFALAVLFLVFIIFFMEIDRHGQVAMWVMGIISCVCIAYIIGHSCVVHKRNIRRENEYQDACNAYEVRSAEIARSTAEQRKKYDQQLAAYSREIKRIQNLLDKLYRINVIPSMYRDSYAAVYLYDWFSTGRADDLDHALSMYVLEEIKSRLDSIIDNQSQMILNQQIIMANQMQSLEQRRQHENMMRMKLDRLQATADERLDYERMIEGNTSTMAFFATADYLRNQ